MWVSCDTFQGSGRVYVNGGSGHSSGGGGAGGRVLIQCESVLFLDENLGGKGMYIGQFYFLAYKYKLLDFILNNVLVIYLCMLPNFS